MDAVLVNDAASRLNVTVHRVFGLAFEYAEEPHSKNYIMNKYLEWEHRHIVPPPVEDFILDVMSGRVLSNEIHK